MKYVTLGSTGITVNKNGFGALPIQRISFEEAAKLLRRAYDGGIRYFDTARFYTDSEEKIGYALSDVRSEIYIASKSMTTDVEVFKKEFEITLKNLKTDYIDVHQFHNPPFVPKPGDGTGLYEAMMELKEQGRVRHIGITNHRIALALEAAESGLYETIQFPFSYLANEEEKKLVALCKEKNIGFICMKGLAGGLIRNGKAAFAGLLEFDNALPIWGIQKMEELEEFLSCNTEDFEQELTPELEAIIEADKAELIGGFCRSCGYCQSACPQGIEISNCARMTLLLGRAPVEQYTTEPWKEKMRKAATCIECGACMQRCPYGLNIPKLLKENVADYQKYL
ncbi:MAG: 4Fe-4S dicluster domain-containing protein [Clostridiales bacterium]|nr:4Fe-4S dicluster domain-containing protein [Clostridiales bacterium]